MTMETIVNILILLCVKRGHKVMCAKTQLDNSYFFKQYYS